MAFTVQHERIVFDIPRPGLVVSFTDADGRALPLKLGDTRVVSGGIRRARSGSAARIPR